MNRLNFLILSKNREFRLSFFFFFLLVITLIPFTSSSKFGYNYLDQGDLISGGNYSIDVNNSAHLDGYTVTTLRDFFETFFDDIYCKLTGCEMSGDLFVNTTGNTTLWAQSELNNDVCLYLMESSTLGFSICNDGSGNNELIISAHNGAGGVSEGLVFDRDSGEIELNGTVTMNYDLDVAGNITGNQIYGEMWNKDDNSFETIDLVTSNVYVRATNLTAGSLNGFSYANGNLTAQVKGTYSVNAKIGAIAAAIAGEYGMKVYINDVGQNNCYDHEEPSISPIGFIITCLIPLNVGDRVNIRFDDHSNPVRDLNLLNANINLVRVGD